jgi:hypothetical protein
MAAKKTANKTTKAKPKATPKKPAAKKPANKKPASKKQIIRRPDPNLPPSAEVVNEITNNVLNLIEQLEDYTANLRALDRCRKAKGFSARSLRYAQTPHIYSWSFAKGKTPKLSGVAG